MTTTPMDLAIEDVVSTPETTSIFLSRRRDVRLIMTPRYDQRDSTGRKIGESVGETIVFRDGRFEIPYDGRVPLEDGRFADGEVVEKFLLTHRLYDNVAEGFWKIDQTAPAPSETELELLQDSALTMNAEKIREFIEREEGGWHRESLLKVARATLAKVEQLGATIAAETAKARDEALAEGRAAGLREAAQKAAAEKKSSKAANAPGKAPDAASALSAADGGAEA